MKRSVPAAVIFTALAAVPAPAWAKPPASLCRAPEPVLFTCDVGRKAVSICGQEQGGAVYRFGRASRIELEATNLHRAHEGWSGGGETQVYADTPTHRYVVYDRMIRTGFDHEGHNIPRRTLSRQDCAQPLGREPPGFDQRLLETLVPEGTYVPH